MLTAVPLLVVLGLLAVRIVYSGRALPGTTLAGVSVEGDSRSSLESRMQRLATAAVTVTGAGQRLKVTPQAAGYRHDVPATVDKVLDVGRTGPVLGFVDTAKGLVGSHDVTPVDHIDPRAMAGTTKGVAHVIDRVSYPGGITVDPATLDVAVRAPRAGRVVDRPRLARLLATALRQGRRVVRAPYRTSAVPARGAIRAVADAATADLAAPLRLTGAGREVVVRPRQLAPLLRLRASADDPTQVRLGSDETALGALVARVAAQRDQKAREPRIAAPARAAIVDGKGRVTWRPRGARIRVVRDGRVGITVDRGAALTAIADAIRTGRHQVRLPVTRDTPKVTPLQARRIDSLIGTFTTRYVAGQPRVTNIRTMARTVDGTIVPPGGQFDLNAIVGPRTKAGGYVKAPFIADGKIVPSIGGGVSQVSTTIYNAAYFAGLRLDTHQPHSFYIDRYPPGREATLDYPSIDMKWTNDTNAPVLVRTSTDATSITVSLYGHNGGRRVTAEPGPRRHVAGRDFRIRVVRTIRRPSGQVQQDSFTTTYDKSPE
ncbi:VanW family protein [Paraconexibacter antarcticus]|uniref:VanW family protein n=1 Tax=Paraconexibacter antarcticus TaxID=2949664 RepID=A0ABY5DW26_9ACTN|nr:VanW family protein [Paraconexibacter antarcticus]UTI65272.1 VanW family protein [Paraconexibacter antarcticus]